MTEILRQGHQSLNHREQVVHNPENQWTLISMFAGLTFQVYKRHSMRTVQAFLVALDGRAGVIAPVNVTVFPNGSGNFPMPQPVIRTGKFTMQIAGEVDRVIRINACSHTTAYFLPG
jgi:hypothetical protein